MGIKVINKNREILDSICDQMGVLRVMMFQFETLIHDPGIYDKNELEELVSNFKHDLKKSCELVDSIHNIDSILDNSDSSLPD